MFLPLTAEESRKRLKEQCEQYYNSDDDSSDEKPSQMGFVSQWTAKVSPDSMQYKSKKAGIVSGGRSKTKKKTGSKDRRRMNLAEEAHCSKTSPRSHSDIKSEMDIDEFSSDEDDCQSYSTTTTGGSAKVEKKERLTPREQQSGGEESLRMDFDDDNPQDTQAFEGFSERDTERPKLSIPAVAAKVPFQLSEKDIKPVIEVPATINQYLRDYQRDGIKFLYKHYINNTGCILGDDMGLGKTIQVIGFIAALLRKQGNHIDSLRTLPKCIRELSDSTFVSSPDHNCKPILIIGPSSVMYNWIDELNTWGYFTVSKYHGVTKDSCLYDVERGKAEIVITSFETFRDNVARLNEISWEVVIVDEVHKIKGLKAQVTQALRIIHTPCRFGLTGTALQNNMMELWSILDWAQPGVLGTLEEFDVEYVKVIENGQRHDASKRELAQARKQKNKFSEVRKRLMLRRTKALLGDQLPTKEDHVVMCRLSEMQQSVYKAIITHPDMEYVLKAQDPCDCHKGKKRASCCYKYTPDGTKAWALVLSFMHLLLKTANHAALLIPDETTSEKQIERAMDVCQRAFKDYPQFIELTRTAALRTLSDLSYCGKMKILHGLLKVFAAKHDKVLLFSYSTKLLNIIEQYVITQGFEYSRIDGKVSSQKRRDIVVQFNKDRNIFICLISTKAGGLGLNLTAANRVIIFDPNWNPSHDLQAQDRAYRIGQTRNVKVYRLVSAGTIEENVYLRQVYKQQLDEVAIGTGNAKRYFLGVQGDKDNKGELFGVKNMFTLRTGDSCLTMDILKRNEKVEKGMAGFDIAPYVPNSVEVDDSNNSREDAEDESDGSDGETVMRMEREAEEEEEEEEEFYRELFGEDRTPAKKTRKIHDSSPENDNKTTAQSENKAASPRQSSDSSLDGFPFLSRSYVKTAYDRHSESTPGPSSTCMDKKTSATVSDITFSRMTGASHETNVADSDLTTFDKSENGLSRSHTKPSSGLSWLFSDSSEESGNEADYDKSMSISDSKKANEKAASSSKNINKKTPPTSPGTMIRIGTVTVEKLSPEKPWTREDFKIKRTNLHFGSKNFKTSPLDDMKEEEENDPKKGSSSIMKISDTNINCSKRNLDGDLSKKIKSSRDESERSTRPPENTDISSLQSVLESGAVVHTHLNPQVVGSSRAEDHMTKCAMEDVFELHTNTQVPAVQCGPYQQSSEEEDDEKSKQVKQRGKGKVTSKRGGARRKEQDPNDARCISSGSFKILVGQTPTGVTRSHWEELCKLRSVDQVALAEQVLALDKAGRTELLRELYNHKYPQLNQTVEQIFKSKEDEQSVTDTPKKAKRGGPKPPTSGQKSRKRQLVQEKPRNPHGKSTKSPRSKTSGVDKKSYSKTDNPSKSKSSFLTPSKKLRTQAASSLFCLSTLVADSQESVTGRDPPSPLFESLEDSEGFQPVPSPAKRSTRSPAKPSPPRCRAVKKLFTNAKHSKNEAGDKVAMNVDVDESYAASSFGLSMFLPLSKIESFEGTQSFGDHVENSEEISNLIKELGKEATDAENEVKECLTETKTKLPSKNIETATTSTVVKSPAKRLKIEEKKKDHYKSLLDDIFQLSDDNETEPEKSNLQSRPSTSKNISAAGQQITPRKSSKDSYRTEHFGDSSKQKSENGRVDEFKKKNETDDGFDDLWGLSDKNSKKKHRTVDVVEDVEMDDSKSGKKKGCSEYLQTDDKVNVSTDDVWDTPGKISKKENKNYVNLKDIKDDQVVGAKDKRRKESVEDIKIDGEANVSFEDFWDIGTLKDDSVDCFSNTKSKKFRSKAGYGESSSRAKIHCSWKTRLRGVDGEEVNSNSNISSEKSSESKLVATDSQSLFS